MQTNALSSRCETEFFSLTQRHHGVFTPRSIPDINQCSRQQQSRSPVAAGLFAGHNTAAAVGSLSLSALEASHSRATPRAHWAAAQTRPASADAPSAPLTVLPPRPAPELSQHLNPVRSEAPQDTASPCGLRQRFAHRRDTKSHR